MTLSGKNKGFGIQDPATNGIANVLQDHLAGDLAICEPWFGDGSIILSRVAPKFKVRVYTRCRVCGRPRSYMRKFQLCRICFRNLALEGKLPGVTKSSW